MSKLFQLQTRVRHWVIKCFARDSVYDRKTRALRLMEEAIEFGQAVGVPREQVSDVADIVYSRPPGIPAQELGGVGVTWLAACEALDLNALIAVSTEVSRIEAIPAAHFQKRNAEKVQP